MRKANLYAKVTWDSPDDPANPKNWTYRRKWTVTLVVGTYTFISTVSTSIVAPALSTIEIALDIHSAFVLSLCLSIFLLAYAFGQFLVGPLSEVYGRVLVLQLANLFYLVFNTACGFANNTAQMVAFRFLAGLGARLVFLPECCLVRWLSERLVNHETAHHLQLEAVYLAIAGQLKSAECRSPSTP